ncbi:bifunctional 2-C-methyl-D-erythritol 4-phosphate cytidylyltransferase/2-C-methyl-D-erythritol 2,4-cyclodiphosphate synthase [Halalkalibacillus sediminis]|uniref:Bifunctional enzyme IspD/IspF n=1 Tax=Halalkalibacillus sediminis TaxID=2018042 RepID=A0A2I0QQK2_9BACI|nr:bifunctional 2-C-methyl-D-erythritol 4-phosphate cytidylyltransferase/2-C-methyl-D-erythritol 2,4-cyclodiphosphate synthase [Halalkalibacillus sediminis]
MTNQYQVIILAAGQGKRMKAGKNKQFIELNGRPLITYTIDVFEEDPWCKEIILVAHPDEMKTMEEIAVQNGFNKISKYVEGGKERQDSVKNAVDAIEDPLITYIHDGARPFVSISELHSLYTEVENNDAAFLAVPVTDTIKRVTKDNVRSLNRSELFAAQTPQAFKYSLIKRAHDQASEKGLLQTDDVSLLEALDVQPALVEGSFDNFKITNPEDIQKAENMLQINKLKGQEEENDLFRIGQGFDVHQLVEGRPCIIGGIEIPYEKGLLGHSDADVLLHTIADAALGAIGAGDIGKHFPDDDPAFKDADSKKLLEEVWKKVDEAGYKLVNIDCTVMAQAPKMAPYIEEIHKVIAPLLQTDIENVNVKATTTEKLGFTGRKEGIASQAVILLQRK